MLTREFSLLYASLPECEPVPLGMTSGDIPDSSITASSYQRHDTWDREPEYARLGGNKFWIDAEIDDSTEPWIQVDMSTSHIVTGLQTEGNYGSNHWQFWSEANQSTNWNDHKRSQLY